MSLNSSVVIFKQPNGAEFQVSASPGQNLLGLAQAHGVDGFAAECGGQLRCGTCHCYIDEQHLPLLHSPQPDEVELLGYVADERRPNSRLACQVLIPDGAVLIKVDWPSRQF